MEDAKWRWISNSKLAAIETFLFLGLLALRRQAGNSHIISNVVMDRVKDGRNVQKFMRHDENL